MSGKEAERLSRKLAIEALTAELMITNPQDIYSRVLSEQVSSVQSTEAINDVDTSVVDETFQNNNDKSYESKLTGVTHSSNKISEKSRDIHSVTYNNDVDEYARSNRIPISHQATLSGHTKAVVTLSVDQSGNRVVTGSLDYNIKIYDFGGMDSRFRAFTSLEPSEGHPVISICHNPSGDKFIIGTGNCQPKIFDRDGNLIISFVRGDMYIRDLSNTKGHTMEITGVYWHPKLKDVVISSSLDGTVRIWDLLGEAAFGNLVNKHVLKIRSMVAAATSQTRIGATCCTISPDGKYYIGGASDGSIHIWQERKIYSRPDIVIKSAHGIVNGESSVTFIVMLSSGNKLISRGLDAMIKVWDIKRPQAPLQVYSGFPNVYSYANLALSPDENFLVCGVGVNAGATRKSDNLGADVESDSSKLCFFNLSIPTVEPSMQITIPNCGTIIFVKWVASTNQILCSTSGGGVKVLFDPQLSSKGVLMASAKPAKREKEPSDFAVVGAVFSPDALPLFQNDPRAQHKRLREEKNATVPERPKMQGPGSRLNTSFFFTQYVTQGKKTDHLRDEDPREALIKMDSVAKSDPAFFGSAYASTQPKTVLASMTFEEEQEEFKKRQKKQLD